MTVPRVMVHHAQERLRVRAGECAVAEGDGEGFLVAGRPQLVPSLREPLEIELTRRFPTA